MVYSEMPLSHVLERGVPYIFANGDFRGSFVVRIEDGDLVPGAVRNPQLGSDAVVGFGAVCTHMGCVLLAEGDTARLHYQPGSQGVPEGAVCGPCPCHGTTFDLLKAGLVVVGPAAQNLPELELQVQGNSLVATGWLASSRQAVDPTEENWPN